MANYSKEELQYIASQVKPYLLELVRANGLDVDTIEVVEDTDGITSLPAYDNRGGVKKVVRVPLSALAKPAQDAADELMGNITAAGEAAHSANVAAESANAAADEIKSLKVEIEQAVDDSQKALEDSRAALDSITQNAVELEASESLRKEAEQSRSEAETIRASEFDSLKTQMAASIEELDAATESAMDISDHPLYVGDDNYVYRWDMESDAYVNTGVMVKGEMGPQGHTPKFETGQVQTVDPSSAASGAVVFVGSDTDGSPVYRIDLSLPKGEKGLDGTGSGNLYVEPSGLERGKKYLFSPSRNGSAEGIMTEFSESYMEVPTRTSQLENDSDFATNTSVDERIAAIPTPDVSGQIQEHNVSELSHEDIRQALASKQDGIGDLDAIRTGAGKGASAVQPSELSAVATSGSYNDLKDKPEIKSDVTEGTVSSWGFISGTETDDMLDDVEIEYQRKLVSGQNIKTVNGTSILGSGDVAVSSAYPLVNHRISDTSFQLTPNVFHVWGEVTALSLSLASGTGGVISEFLFQFSSGSTPTVLSLPDYIEWVKAPVIEAGKTYQVSIVNNIGLFIAV